MSEQIEQRAFYLKMSEEDQIVNADPPEVDSGDTDQLVSEPDGNQQQNVEVKVYKRRWYILFVFSLLGIYQVINLILPVKNGF